MLGQDICPIYCYHMNRKENIYSINKKVLHEEIRNMDNPEKMNKIRNFIKRWRL